MSDKLVSILVEEIELHFKHMGDFFGAQKDLITHVKNYFCDVSFSKPSPRSESWENGVPRIGPRTSPPSFLRSFGSRSTI